MYMCFSKTPALSPTGDIRPFSEKGDGTMLGEGISMMALRRLEDAEADGDKIYAILNDILPNKLTNHTWDLLSPSLKPVKTFQ